MTANRIAAALLLLPALASAETRDDATISYGTSNNFFEALSGNLQVYRSEFTIDRRRSRFRSAFSAPAFSATVGMR